MRGLDGLAELPGPLTQCGREIIEAAVAGQPARLRQLLTRALKEFTSHQSFMRPEQPPEDRYSVACTILLRACLDSLADSQRLYSVESEASAGDGLADILILPIGHHNAGAVLEFKVSSEKVSSEKGVAVALNLARAQIRERNRGRRLTALGVPADHVFQYAVAFWNRSAAAVDLVPFVETAEITAASR
jgi:hypothetical protein